MILYLSTMCMLSFSKATLQSQGWFSWEEREVGPEVSTFALLLLLWRLCKGYADLPTNFFQNVWFCHPIYAQLLNLLEWKCLWKVLKVSGISLNVSGKSAKCVTLNEWVTNQLIRLIRPKMRGNTCTTKCATVGWYTGRNVKPIC